MNKFEKITTPTQESDQFGYKEHENIVYEPKRLDVQELQNTPDELVRISEIRNELLEKTKPTKIEKQNIPENPIEIEEIAGKKYFVEYVPKEDIYPAYGYALGNNACVRQDLPPRVKKFVRAHELYHCTDKAVWGGTLGREIRANVVPGLKDPVGLIATVWETMTNIDRIKFYLERIRGNQ